MIVLDATNRSLEIDLNGAVTTNQLPFVASYVDIGQTDFDVTGVSTNTGQSNNTTAVTIVSAPGASTSRQLKYFSIRNADTASAIVTVQLNDNATLREIGVWTLAVDDSLVYTDSEGFVVLDSTGGRKYAVADLTQIIDTDNDTSVEVERTADVDTIHFQVAGTDVGQFDSNGTLFINDTANANMTVGLTLNMGAADNEVLTLKSTDVAHGITDETETDSFGIFKKSGIAAGGIFIGGYSTGIQSTIDMLGVGDGEQTGKSTAGFGQINLRAAKKNVAAKQDLGSNGNLVAIANNVTVRFILDADGDSHQDVGTAWTNFDDHDDLILLSDFRWQVSRPDDPIKRRFGKALGYNRERLQKMKLVQFNEDGHHFVNMSRLAMLNTSAIVQVGLRIRDMTERERIMVAVADEMMPGFAERLQRRLGTIEHRP